MVNTYFNLENMTNRSELILKLNKKIQWIDFIDEMENRGFLKQNLVSTAFLNHQKKPIRRGSNKRYIFAAY